MSFFNLRKLRGLASRIQLGKGGPNLKDSSGKIQARNAADSALAILQAASGVASDDVVTVAQLGATNLTWWTNHGFNQTSLAENFIPINNLAESTASDYFQKVMAPLACKITKVVVWPTPDGVVVGPVCGLTDIRIYEVAGPTTGATRTLLKTVQVNMNASSAFVFDFSADPAVFAQYELATISIDCADNGPDQTVCQVQWELIP